MKNCLRLFLPMLVVTLPTFAEKDVLLENRRLMAEYKALQAQANALQKENQKDEKTIRVLGVTRELMDGTRQSPPKAQVAGEVVHEEGKDASIFLACTEKLKEGWEKGLSYHYASVPYGGGFLFPYGPNKDMGRVWPRTRRGVDLKEVCE